MNVKNQSKYQIIFQQIKMDDIQNKKQSAAQQQEMHACQSQHERKHKIEIKTAFANYSVDLKKEYSSLFQKQQSNQYYAINQERKSMMLNQALQSNQSFLNAILEYINQMEENIDFQPLGFTTPNNRSKIKTTVKQFFREWCAESVEKDDYLKLVKKCQQYLKPKDLILVPGCGLGRLVFELIKAGFGAEGNELTYFMLFGSNFIINCAQRKEQFKIYPFINSPDYYYNEEDIFRSSLIPDVCARQDLSQIPEQDLNFAIVAGQFTQVYNQRPACFQGITTCFFLDTANNVFDYVDTIARTLKDGAIWINFGPLLYHYREIYDQVSIEVSWQKLKAYISTVFQFIQQSFEQTQYCHDPKSEMSVIYKCIFFVCKKKSQK